MKIYVVPMGGEEPTFLPFPFFNAAAGFCRSNGYEGFFEAELDESGDIDPGLNWILQDDDVTFAPFTDEEIAAELSRLEACDGA
ncbi:MAG: hypothetical protein WA797_06250 [Acidimicrobiales bacterium]